MVEDKYGIRPLQEKMLDLLKKFIEMCDKNELTYFACGGTCLGAVRHNGFIPWDDDLDVFMPRPDYEKLWKKCGGIDKTGKYMLCRTTQEKNYHHRVMQLVNLETTFINRRSIKEDIEHGVYIDIIPLDARPDTFIKKLTQSLDCILFSVYNIQNLPEFNGGKLQKIMVGLLLKAVKSPEHRYKIWSRAEKRMSQYDWKTADEVIELTTAFKNLWKPRPQKWFNGVVKHDFEDIQINLMAEYEKYLTQGFGDYMKLPPESEQHPRHNTVLIDLEHSYKVYRGKAYLVEKE